MTDHPDLPEPGAVLSAVKHASRRLRRWPAAMLDRSCARHRSAIRSGQRNGLPTEQRNTQRGPIPAVAKGSVPDVAGHSPSKWRPLKSDPARSPSLRPSIAEHRRVCNRAIKFVVGTMILAFGTFWTLESLGGAGIRPLSDWRLLGLVTFYFCGGLGISALVRAQLKPGVSL